MNATYFSPVQRWVLPEKCLPISLDELSIDGKQGKEGLVLWLGHKSDGIATVSHLMKLRGDGIIKEPDYLEVKPWLFGEVTVQAAKHNLVLVGQIHSHGPYYGVDLSPSDRVNGICTPYYLSVVAPDFGLNKNTMWQDCGVHVYYKNEGFMRISEREIYDHIQVEPGASIGVLTVGEE